MKLISINIEQNKHLKIVLPFLEHERPDVVCCLEICEADVPKFEKLLGMQSFFKRVNKGLFEKDGHEDYVGNAVFARNFLSKNFQYYFGDESSVRSYEHTPDPKKFRNNSQIPLLWMDVEHEDVVFRLATTHLTWTMEGESTPYQLEDVEKMLSITKTLGELVLVGDFNAPRGGETFSCIARIYKDNIPPEYKTSIDQNLHKVKGLQYMVDGLFTTPAYVASGVKLVDGVSDHMAIVANIDKI
jgi:endonuclease/exonuclease/phosphatase family metal-dependent hydrolase